MSEIHLPVALNSGVIGLNAIQQEGNHTHTGTLTSFPGLVRSWALKKNLFTVKIGLAYTWLCHWPV